MRMQYYYFITLLLEAVRGKGSALEVDADAVVTFSGEEIKQRGCC